MGDARILDTVVEKCDECPWCRHTPACGWHCREPREEYRVIQYTVDRTSHFPMEIPDWCPLAEHYVEPGDLGEDSYEVTMDLGERSGERELSEVVE